MFPTQVHFSMEKLPFFVPKEPPVLTINRCCSLVGFPWCSYVFLISAILQGADYSKIPRKLLEVLQDYIASSTTWRLSCHQPLGSSVGRWVGCGCLGLWGGRRLSDRTEISVQDSKIVPSCPVPQFLLVTYLYSDGWLSIIITFPSIFYPFSTKHQSCSPDTPAPVRKSTNFRRAGRRGDDARLLGRGEEGDDEGDQGMEMAVDVSEAWHINFSPCPCGCDM